MVSWSALLVPSIRRLSTEAKTKERTIEATTMMTIAAGPIRQHSRPSEGARSEYRARLAGGHCPRLVGSTPAIVNRSAMVKSPVTVPLRCGSVGRHVRPPVTPAFR